MRSRFVSEDRRAFLGRLAATGAIALVDCTRCASPAPVVSDARRDLYAFEILEAPLVLRSGEVLAGRSFALSKQFRGAAVIVVAGNGVAVRDLRILGPGLAHASMQGPGGVGLRIEDVRDVAVEGVWIDGFSGAGITGHGIQGGLLRDLTIRNCRSGVALDPAGPSRALRLERIYAEGGEAARPSAGVGFSLGSLSDSVVVDCCAAGESGSLEFTNPRGVRIQGVRGATLRIEGTLDREPSAADAPVREVGIRDCLLDKGLGEGAALFERSCLELSQTVGSVRVERCVLNGAGQNGHAIELTANSHVRVVDCVIRGFNGVSGAMPSHAIHLSGGSTVNADFERVNHFVEQQRIRSGELGRAHS